MNVTEVLSFLGLTGYYPRLGLSNIATSITKLIWKDVKFKWTAKCEKVSKS